MRVLGIESSCDDTGIAIIENGKILENIVIGQSHLYGVIPEFAARAHHVVLYEATKSIFKDVDLIAYTNGPGLMGSLFVGSCFARGLSYSSGIPSIAVDHLVGHIMLPYWLCKFDFPFLCLLISGGHTILINVVGLEEYNILSKSIDDAVGEVFDKVARHIGLGYPGGVEIEKLSQIHLNKYKYTFPMPMKNRDDFSFSGLKTAAIMQINKESSNEEKADFCYQFQEHIAKILLKKFELNYKKYSVKNWVISGGVAANKIVRMRLKELSDELGCSLYFPELKLCTDNGVMIACVGELLYKKYGASSLNVKPYVSSIVFK